MKPDALASMRDSFNREDASFCLSLALIFCLSFFCTLTRTPPSKNDAESDFPSDFVPAATPIVAVTPPTPAKVEEVVDPPKTPATPRTTEKVRKALQPILFSLPDEKSSAPLHCGPKKAPSGALSAKTMHDVDALRAAIEARKGGWSAAVAAEAEAQLDDFSLARWVVGQLPAPPAEAFEQAMKWRVENKVGELYAELHPLARQQMGATARQHVVQQHFYGGVGGLARDGTPFLVERLGTADFGGYARQGNVLELMKQAYIAHLETHNRAVRVASALQGRFAMGFVVIDTKGVGASLLFNLALVKFAAKVGLANFPEGTDEVFVVNAPGIVARAFGVIAPLLPEDTRKKVKILSVANTRAALERMIDPSEIPAFLGGEKPDAELAYPAVAPMPRTPVDLS